MPAFLVRFSVVVFILALCSGLPASAVSTDGEVTASITLHNYNGSSDKHWTAAWVATQAGTFIKTLWKQGPSITSSKWDDHTLFYWNARSGNTNIDGYSGATARTYSGIDSPVLLEWDGRDASDNLMEDGNYVIWLQYAEDSGQGPYTNPGLTWTKGPVASTNNYPNQTRFSGMEVIWIPDGPPPEAPTITSAVPTGTATLGVPYTFTSTATGTAPITFTASGLPPMLTMSPAGVISGLPAAVGTFPGTITAANGTAPDATQNFSIEVDAVPPEVTTVRVEGSNLVILGQGPPNGIVSVLQSSHPDLGMGLWTPLAAFYINSLGEFGYTNTLDPGALQRFYHFRMPN